MKDKMAKLIEITGKALSGEWGNDDNTGNGIPVLRTTNFTNEGIVNYNNVVTRIIEKKKIEEKYLRKGDIIIEKSGGSDKQPVGRVVYFDGPENTYLFNNFTGLLRVKDQAKWYPRYVFYSLFSNYHRGGTQAFQNKTTGLHNLKIDDFVSRCEVTEAGINEQIAACKQMDRVNDIIRMHQQQLQKLDELVKARFVELFGDPLKNEKCLPVVSGEALFKLSNGKALPNNKRFDTGVPAYGGNGISWYTDEILCDYDTIIVGRVGFQSGNVHLVKAPLWVTDNAMYISNINSRECDIRYLCALMEHIDFTRYQDAGDLKKITQKPFMQMHYLMPPLPLQKQYIAFVEQADKSKVATQGALWENKGII